MKITIKLLSDLCTCSGETYNSVVDMDVVYLPIWFMMRTESRTFLQRESKAVFEKQHWK